MAGKENNVRGASVATDARIETFLGQMLRVGVLLAAAVVLVGGVLYLKNGSGSVPDYRTFHGEPSALRQVRQVVKGSVQFEALSVIQLGLLLLIATPVARVVFSIVGFAMERDWLYIGVTLVVLALLIYSLMSGAHG